MRLAIEHAQRNTKEFKRLAERLEQPDQKTTGQFGWPVWLPAIPMIFALGASTRQIVEASGDVASRLEHVSMLMLVSLVCSAIVALLVFLYRGDTLRIEALWGTVGGGAKGYTASPTTAALLVLAIAMFGLVAISISKKSDDSSGKKLELKGTLETK